MNLRNLDRMCISVIIVVSILCGYWAVSRALKLKEQIQQENDLLSKGMKDLNLAATSLEQLKGALKNTRRQFEALNERIPGSGRIGEFLKQLDILMKERAIALISLHPMPAVKEKVYARIPIRLILKGSFFNIYHMLQDLETMNRIVVMEKITIKKSDPAKECRVDLTAGVFER